MKKYTIYMISILILVSSVYGLDKSNVIDSWEFQNNFSSIINGYSLVPNTNFTFQTENKKFGSWAINITNDENKYLLTNISNDTYLNTHAVEFWVYPVDGNGYYFLTSLNGSNSVFPSAAYSFYYTAGGEYWREVDNAFFTILSNNNWHHVVYTYDSIGVNSYYDGVFSYNWNLVPPQNSLPTSDIMLFSGFTNLNRHFTGLSNMVRVWNTNLTQNDVTLLYNSGTGLTYSQLSDRKLNFTYYSNTPYNNSATNKTTILYYDINNINITANCTFLINDSLIESVINITTGSYSISFNSSYWFQGENVISMNCNDVSQNITEIKSIFLDNIKPNIISINETSGSTIKELNTSVFSSDIYVNISLTINDTNLNNVSIYVISSNNGSIIYSNKTNGITDKYYTAYHLVNLENHTFGRYYFYITANDYHNNTIINLKNVSGYFDYFFTQAIFFIRDSNSKQLINPTNMTIQYIGNYFQNQTTTINGTSYLDLKFDNEIDTPSIRVFSTNIVDYSLIIQNALINQSQGNKNITVYVTNTSSIDTTNLVKFHVQDEDYNFLQGAIISIYKQDPATNTYILITQLTTNSNGEATTILETDNYFYRWEVAYNNKSIYTLIDPVSLTVNDDDIWIIGAIGNKYSEEYSKMLDTYGKVTLVKISNTSGYFQYVYQSNYDIDACLIVYLINQTNQSLNYSYCSGGTGEKIDVSGNITTPVIYSPTRQYFTGIGTAGYSDGNDAYFIGSDSGYIGNLPFTLPQGEGVYLLILLVLFSVFGFTQSPIIGLIIFSINLILVFLTGLVPIVSLGTIMALISIIIISIFTITRKNE